MIGSVDQAAAAPGRWAAMPAPAMITLSPRSRAPRAHSAISGGVRCAESTFSSDSIPISCRMSAHFCITGRSDLLPTTMPTSTKLISSLSPSSSGLPPPRRRDLVLGRAAENTWRRPRRLHGGDVVAVEAALKAYPADVVISPIAGFGQGLAGGNHGEDPAATGDVATSGAPRARAEGHDIAVEIVQTGDGKPGDVIARVTAAGDDHAHRWPGAPLEADVSKVAVGAGNQGWHQIACHSRQQDLGLGVAEPGIEFDHHRALFGQHDLGIEATAVRRLPTRHLLDHRLGTLTQDPGHHLGVDIGGRAVGAHAAGIW